MLMIPIVIAIAWLNVVTTTVGWVAARADAAEVETYRGMAVPGTRTDPDGRRLVTCHG